MAEITGAILNISTPPGAARPAITVTVDAVPPGSAALAHYSIALASGRSWRIAVTDHLWAPQHYEAIAGGLVRSMPRTPCDGRSPLAARLLDLDADVIQRENIRISARLQTNMACAAAHEEAALLLGALALREAAGPFSDPRRLLARMTAHLAVADALHGAPQVVRRLADALLMTLVGRQRSALDLVRALEPDAEIASRALADRRPDLLTSALRRHVASPHVGRPPVEDLPARVTGPMIGRSLISSGAVGLCGGAARMSSGAAHAGDVDVERRRARYRARGFSTAPTSRRNSSASSWPG